MDNLEELVKLQAECRLACVVEAISKGLPIEAGYDMYDACYLDIFQTRSESQVLHWIKHLKEKYGGDSSVELNPLRELYEACSQIMENYINLSLKTSDSEKLEGYRQDWGE